MVINLKHLFAKKTLAFSLVDQVFSSANNFLTTAIVARASSKSDLGVYMMGYAAISFLITVQNALVGSPYTITHPTLDAEDGIAYTGSTVLQQVSFGSLVSVLFALAGMIAYRTHPDIGALLLILSVVLIPTLLREFLRRICLASGRTDRAAALNFSVFILQLAGLGLIFWKSHLSSYSAIAITGAVAALVTVTFLLGGWIPLRIDLGRYRRDLAHNWGVGRWVVLGHVFWAASLYGCPWLITALKGTAAAGTWAVCFGLTSFMNPIMIGLQNHTEPNIARTYAKEGNDGLRNVVKSEFLLFTVLMSSVSLFVLLFGDRIITLIYGPKYAGQALTTFAIALFYSLGAISFPLSCALNTKGVAHLDARINVLHPICFIILGIPLTNYYGITGTALCITTATLLAFIIRVNVYRSMIRKSLTVKIPASCSLTSA